MSNFSFARIGSIGAMVASLLLATSCGGGTADLGVGSGGTGFISGAVAKGPVGGATVTAYAIAGGQMAAQLGMATTDASGNFNLAIGAHAGPVMLQVSGGSYTDEAKGISMAMGVGDVMTVAMTTIAAGTTTSGVQITPVTAMAQTLAQHMAGGMTDANITKANTAMGNYFAVSDIVRVQPMNPLVAGSGAGMSLDAQNYGMTLAAMSKYAQTLGLSASSAMVTAMMNDAADGMMDGKAGSVAVQMGGMAGGMMMPSTAGTSGMGAALNAFMNSAQNKSGVTTPGLLGLLNGANGQIMGGATGMTGTQVSGKAFNGPVSQAMVTAFAVDNGARGAQIASTATDNQGNFTLTLGAHAGPVMLQMSAGTYLDEATGTTMTMGVNDLMGAVIPAVSPGTNLTGIWITPLTSMAQAWATGMSGGMSEANIVAANSAIGEYFSVSDIVHSEPMNPMVAGAGASASQNARNHGMALAAMSQYAKTLNMTVSSALVTVMMNDASDGVMDGKRGASQISMPMSGMMGTSLMKPTAGTSDMATAMTSFLASAANASGMSAADMAALIQKLTMSGGHL